MSFVICCALYDMPFFTPKDMFRLVKWNVTFQSKEKALRKEEKTGDTDGSITALTMKIASLIEYI